MDSDPAQVDLEDFATIDDCLSRITTSASRLLEHHVLDGSSRVFGLLSSIEAEAKTARKYLGLS